MEATQTRLLMRAEPHLTVALQVGTFKPRTGFEPRPSFLPKGWV
jgi:hypothetical protein